MRTISDTIGRLARMRSQRELYVPDVETSSQLCDLGEFGTDPGNLRARYFASTDLPPGAPLVVVLHGCTQDAAVYDHGSGWSRLAAQAGFAVLYPEQRRANNAHLCFNLRIPTLSGRAFQPEAGHRSDVKPATIPINIRPL